MFSVNYYNAISMERYNAIFMERYNAISMERSRCLQESLFDNLNIFASVELVASM